MKSAAPAIKRYLPAAGMTALWCVLFCSWLSASGFAAGEYDEFGNYTILAGEIFSIEAKVPKRVVIRDPAVLDIVRIADSVVEIIGKTEGKTDVTIYDTAGTRSYSVTVYAEDMASLKERISDLLFRKIGVTEPVRIQEDEVSRKLIIIGELYEDELKKVNDALAPVNKYILNFLTPKKQQDSVKIDVQILELSKDAVDKLGFEWMDHFQVREEPYVAPAATGVTTTLNQAGSFNEVFRFLNLSRDALTLKFNSLITQGKGKILSRPQIVCVSGEEANFLVGGEVPVQSQNTTDAGTATSTTYKEYGIKLKMKPEVLPDDRIKMKLETEVSEIDSSNTFSGTSGKQYAFLKRNATTQLFLEPGQTVFIAGMIKNNENTDIQKVPFLSEIPILSALFRSKDFSSGQSELVISLTPEIIRAPQPQNRTSRTTAEERSSPAGPAGETRESAVYTIPDSAMMGYKTGSVNQEYFLQAVTNYIYTVQRLITESLKNPPLAEDPSWESAMKLRLHLLSDGSLRDVEVLEYSGYRLFDTYVIETAKKISPYPEFSPEMQRDDLWLEIPIVYAKSQAD